MNRPFTDDFTEEQLDVIQLASAVEQMLRLPAWHWLESRLSAIVENAQRQALNARTDHERVELCREWQMKDEVVSTIRMEIQQRLDERDALLNNPADLQAIRLKEQMHGRPHVDGDPAGATF